MRVILFIAMVWLSAELMASANPVTPLHLPDAPKPFFDLAGTSWQTLGKHAGRRVHFLPAGKLRYETIGKTGKSSQFSGGTWRLDSEFLSFVVNNYSEHRARIVGNLIEVHGTNKDGAKWSMKLERMLQK